MVIIKWIQMWTPILERDIKLKMTQKQGGGYLSIHDIAAPGLVLCTHPSTFCKLYGRPRPTFLQHSLKTLENKTQEPNSLFLYSQLILKSVTEFMTFSKV